MSNYTLTSYMSLPNPNPGIDPGPDYASNIYSSFVLVDQHNHTPGYGQQIPPSGLDISSDLTFNSNNATSLRSVRFTNQSASFAAASDIGCLYELQVSGNGELYYRDSSGNNVQITNQGTVNATSSFISSGNNRALFVANQFTVYSNFGTNTPGNIVAGSILIGNNTTASNFITLQPTNALASSYSLTLPLVPSATAALEIDTSGNIAASNSGLVPPGTMLAFGGTAAPAGYLLCDGASYLRATYPNLFAAIGTAYGTADGTHFNVPQLQGLFMRGVDNGTGNDPNSNTRIAAATGGNTGDNVGSLQLDSFASHTHFLSGGNNPSIGGTLTIPAVTPVGSNNYTDPTGGSETRPRNLYVTYIIKY